MALDFSQLTSVIGNALPNNTQIVQQVLTGALAGVAISGFQAQMKSGALPDPLHLATPAAPAAPQVNNTPAVTVSPTITASAFQALNAASQGAFLASGGHIIAG